ncbi:MULTISPECIES: porin [Vibrio]|uniref:Porin n=1 Tax=Vibrio chanodichtyis TaxID=3027932 RepID=A0ABT5V150_9VIBR|nr:MULTISPECIES: porin [Vibrio]MDE1514817.1 porin [Vibrio chanodichtyis]
MKKSNLAIIVALALSAPYSMAASVGNMNVSGFGSVGVGIANNDAGYAGYENKVDYKQDSLLGLQFDFQVNDRAKVTTQLVANGRYDFDPTVEVAYLSYDLDFATVRGGKLRTPFFMYSDYLDVGYAYPMLRPSQEIYELLIISNFTGIDALIPIKLGNTTLQLQPFTGVSQVEERDSTLGSQVDIKDAFGLTANWYIDDWTLRGSYTQARTEEHENLMVSDKKSTFASFGLQYNDGALLFNTEGMLMKLSGKYPDVQAVSALLGYQFGAFTPYVASAWVKSTDNDQRTNPVESIFSMKRTSYSAGMRWDLAPKVALKTEVTYADFHGTVGGITSNVDLSSFKPLYDDSLVYSVSLDFVF